MVSMDYIAKPTSDVRRRKSMSAFGQSYARRSMWVPLFNRNTQTKLGVVPKRVEDDSFPLSAPADGGGISGSAPTYERRGAGGMHSARLHGAARPRAAAAARAARSHNQASLVVHTTQTGAGQIGHRHNP